MTDGRRPNACHGNRDLALPGEVDGRERLDNVAVDERGMVADRMWAVRDPELGSITTARRRPALLRCGARYAGDPLGSAPEVVIVLPDGEEISSADPAVHARLSELVGSEVRLEPIPPSFR
jgi:MOSC domain-containing protein